MIRFACRVIASLVAMIAAAAFAQSIPQGTYAMPDSGYAIVVTPQGDDLSVIEAGKTRTYTGQGDGSYRYFSDITQATYELRFRDRGSITAKKLGGSGAPTLLVRQGGPAPEERVEAPPPAAAPVAAAGTSPPPSPYLAVAEKYQALTLTDKKDVQTWAFCSAAALKRGVSAKEDADAYGREAATRLASISVDPSRNPCPDAIPAELWPRPDAEAEALKAINAEQASAAAKQRAEIEAMRVKAAADQKAFEQASADHRAALEKSRQDQEAFARAQAAYQAALAERQRIIDAQQRKGGGN